MPTNPTLALRLLFTATLSIAASTHAADWYRWRGPDLNGISTETGWSTNWPAEGPKQLWKTTVGLGYSSFAISQGRAYTTGHNGSKTDGIDTIYCFDAVTGQEVWKHSFPCPLDDHFYQGGTTGTPTVDGDQVYSISKKGDLFCLDAAKGTVVWSKSLPKDYGYEVAEWGIASSPFIVGDVLYLNAGKSGTALNKKTGAIVWASDKSGNGYGNVVPFKSGGEERLAIFSSGTMEVVKMSDGKSLWSYPWKNSSSVNAGDPIISDGKMFFGSGYSRGCTLLDISKEQPASVWENKNICNRVGVPILWKGYIYCSQEKARGQLTCLDWNTGEVKWSEPTMGQAGLTMADGKLIILSEKGELVVAEASPDAFKPICRAKVLNASCWTNPVLSNSRVYCRDCKGNLVCVDVSGK
jgi:outer membrane protein assembly factor BamB